MSHYWCQVQSRNAVTRHDLISESEPTLGTTRIATLRLRRRESGVNGKHSRGQAGLRWPTSNDEDCPGRRLRECELATSNFDRLRFDLRLCQRQGSAEPARVG